MTSIKSSVRNQPSNKQGDFLILGHPRGGTGYMAEVFQQLGYDVRHEVRGKHGTSNWMWAARSVYKPWNEQDNTQAFFNYVIHVIREPVSAIASIAYTENNRKKSLAFREKYIYLPFNCNYIRQAVYSYIGWHQLIKSWAPHLTVKTGEALQPLKSFLIHKGYGYNENASEPGKRNSRQHPSLSYADISAKIDKPLREKFDEWIDYYNSL